MLSGGLGYNSILGKCRGAQGLVPWERAPRLSSLCRWSGDLLHGVAGDVAIERLLLGDGRVGPPGGIARREHGVVARTAGVLRDRHRRRMSTRVHDVTFRLRNIHPLSRMH